MQRNLKASSLLSIASGLLLLSLFFENLSKTKTSYFGLAFAILIFFNGLYGYFVRNKDLKILPSKPYGIFCLIAGTLFFAGTTINLYKLEFNYLSLALGYAAALITFVLGFILITKKNH